METVIIFSEIGILLVRWWLVCNASQWDWKQRELLVPLPQQGEADTVDNTNADTINADTINRNFSLWCP